MKTPSQKAQLKALIDRADAVSKTARAEIRRAVLSVKKELVYQLSRVDISRSAERRDKLIEALQRQIAGLEKRLDGLLDAQNEYASRQGYGAAGALLGGKVVKYSQEHAEAVMEKVRARGGESMAATMTQSMSRNLVQALRNATVAAFNEQAVNGLTQRELAKVIRSKWEAAVKDPDALSFKDRAGRVWNTGNYLMMSVRTNSMSIYNDMVVDTVTRTTGSDLMMISDDGGTADSCDACQRWAGRIVSITGATKGFPTIDEARADGVFHPNCTHTLEPVDEELDADEIERQRR